MKHGHVSSFTVSYDELARRLESVGETLLYTQSDRPCAPTKALDNHPCRRAIPVQEMDPKERERLGLRLLEQARKMRADATWPRPDRAQHMWR